MINYVEIFATELSDKFIDEWYKGLLYSKWQFIIIKTKKKNIFQQKKKAFSR